MKLHYQFHDDHLWLFSWSYCKFVKKKIKRRSICFWHVWATTVSGDDIFTQYMGTLFILGVPKQVVSSLYTCIIPKIRESMQDFCIRTGVWPRLSRCWAFCAGLVLLGLGICVAWSAFLECRKMCKWEITGWPLNHQDFSYMKHLPHE